jgi:hypothetical protein
MEPTNDEYLPVTGTILHEAQHVIRTVGREKHGDALESFDNIAAGWEVILDVPVTGTQVALCMDWAKTVRFTTAQDRESLVAKGSYTALAARVAEIDE